MCVCIFRFQSVLASVVVDSHCRALVLSSMFYERKLNSVLCVHLRTFWSNGWFETFRENACSLLELPITGHEVPLEGESATLAKSARCTGRRGQFLQSEKSLGKTKMSVELFAYWLFCQGE